MFLKTKVKYRPIWLYFMKFLFFNLKMVLKNKFKKICVDSHLGMGHFSLIVFVDHIFSQVSLSQRATCHILSGHKESTSLFEAAAGLWQVEELSGRGTPPLWPWIPARWDGQLGSWGLDVGCSRRAAAMRVVGQAMLADRWIGGQKSGLQRKDTKERNGEGWRHCRKKGGGGFSERGF